MGCHHGTILCKSRIHHDQTTEHTTRQQDDDRILNWFKSPLQLCVGPGSPLYSIKETIPKSNDVEVACVESSQHHGQVIGLGAAVGQIHHLDG